MPSITITDLTNAKLDTDTIAEIATSLANTTTDRLGNVKQTMTGAIGAIAGITNRGAWTTATAYLVKDIVSIAGTWYVCVVAHTSSAAFATDSATDWRVYQGVIAVDLAASAGSSTVGFYGTNVQDQLNANISELGVHAGDIATNTTDIATNVAAIATNKSDLAVVRNTIVGTNLAPLVVDLHFGTLCGTGWLGDATELGGYTPTPTTASAATSALGTTISVVDPTIFRVGQLMCYLAPSLTWYSANVDSISGSVLTLDRELPEGISIGASVIYFYATDAHPNEYGYMTIADDALRQLTKKEELSYIGRNYEIWTPVAAATVAAATLGAVSAASYLIPGATINADRSALVTCTGVGDGATSDWVALAAGEYNTHLALNSGERTGALSGSVQASIEELRTDGNIYAISTLTVAGFSGVRAIDIAYKTSPGSAVRVKVVSNDAGAATFYLGKLTHGKIIESPASLNHGTHVLLGDSWFASGYLMTHLQARLPLATFINKGIAGNRATDLIGRFDADVRPSGANFVWVVCGTNDYYADVTASLFEQQINQLTAMICSIGAQPINWNASVGDALYAVAPFERLTVSRQYAVEVNYHAHTASPNGIGAKYRSANLFANAVSIPAGGSVVLGVTPGKTYLQAFLKNLFTSAGGLNIWVGYAGIIDGTTLVDQSTFASAAEIKNTILTRADTQPRYVLVVANNPSGAPIVTSMVADIAWVQA